MAVTNLKWERTRKGLTQYDLADIVECNRSYISLLETQRETPSEELGKKLEAYFNKPISYLLKKVE